MTIEGPRMRRSARLRALAPALLLVGASTAVAGCGTEGPCAKFRDEVHAERGLGDDAKLARIDVYTRLFKACVNPDNKTDPQIFDEMQRQGELD